MLMPYRSRSSRSRLSISSQRWSFRNCRLTSFHVKSGVRTRSVSKAVKWPMHSSRMWCSRSLSRSLKWPARVRCTSFSRSLILCSTLSFFSRSFCFCSASFSRWRATSLSSLPARSSLSDSSRCSPSSYERQKIKICWLEYRSKTLKTIIDSLGWYLVSCFSPTCFFPPCLYPFLWMTCARGPCLSNGCVLDPSDPCPFPCPSPSDQI